MYHPYAVLGFLAAVLPLVATPGASVALLVRHVTDRGRRRAALPVVLGTVTGLYVHALLAMAGLSALVMHSSQAFAAVRLIGAGYLMGLAVWTWRTAGRPPAPARSRSRSRSPGGRGSPYVQALLGNVLNPKAASIYLTLVPQFITPGDSFYGQVLVLATAHAVLVGCWLAGWTVLVRRAAGALRTARVRRVAARVTATVFLTLALRTATA